MFLNVFHNFCTEDKITFVGFFSAFYSPGSVMRNLIGCKLRPLQFHIISVQSVLTSKYYLDFYLLKWSLYIYCTFLCVFICLYLITGFSSSRCQNKARLKQNFAFCDFSREIVYSCLGSGIHFWSYSSFYFRHFHRESEKHLVQTCQDILAVTNNM